MHVTRPETRADKVLKLAMREVFTRAAERGLAVDSLAKQIYKSHGNVCKYGRPDDHTTFVSVHDIPLLAEIVDVTPVMEALCGLVGGEFRMAPQCATADSIRDQALLVAKESGDVSGSVAEALQDGNITRGEAREIIKECLEAQEALSKQIAKVSAIANGEEVEG